MTDRSDPSRQIFLSYASEDAERIGTLVEALEGHQWSVFWDRQIPPGATWREMIGEALEQARVVVVVWSQHSVQSRWVIEEAEQGLERGVLVPVMLDDVELPLGFRSVQTASLTAWKGSSDQPAFVALAERVSELLGTPPSKSKSRPSRIRFSRAVLSGVLTTIAVGLLGWGAWSRRAEGTTEYRRVFYEGFDEPFGGTSDVWLLGRRDETAWVGSVRDGTHQLCNADDDPTASFTNRLAYDSGGEKAPRARGLR